MDVELALNKFVESSIKHKIKEEDEVTYSEHHASLLVIFCFSIADKIHPKKFENNFVEGRMRLMSKKGECTEVDILLDDLQILHFKLLYHIVYLHTFYPEVSSKFKFSEDLSELLNNEVEIIKLYKVVKKISLN